MGDVEKDDKLKEWAACYSYPMIIGSLIHAQVHTRPDIGYAVSILSRSMTNPTLAHYKAARCTLLYLRTTRELGIEYHQKNMLKNEQLVTATTDEQYDSHYEAAVDASFADDRETYRSTSGFVIWFGCSPIDWECKRQPLVTMSTMESEYVAASKCVLSIRFLHKFLDFVELKRSGPTRVHEDNAACIAISDKPVHRARSKHIGVKYHNVREAVHNGEVKLLPVWTEHQVADIATKQSTKANFIRCRETLMGRVPFWDLVKNHPKPVDKDVKQYYVENQRSSWPEVVAPMKQRSYAWHIMGYESIQIPGYDEIGYILN